MCTIFLVLVALDTVTCARILAIAPSPFYSHQIFYRPIWRELSLRGHQVTLITTDAMKNPSLTNLTEIDISFTYKIFHEDHQMQDLFTTKSKFMVFNKRFAFFLNNVTSEQLKHPQVEELIRSDNHFDLIIAETYIPAWFGLAKKFHCPIINIAPLPAANFFKGVMGNMNHFVYTHSVNLPFGYNLNILQKTICVIFEIFEVVLYRYYFYPLQERMIRNSLGDPEIKLLDIFKNVSLMINNEITGFNRVATIVPSMVVINGLHIKPPQEISGELKHFLDEAKQGVIYFSLGSNVKSHLILEEKISIFVRVFEELPYKIVWKFEDKVNNLPRNVKVMSWTPQQDILRHKNTKLFITQGGVLSIDEAIRFKVPLLGMPFFGDQFHNVIRFKELKLGSLIDVSTITKEKLKQAVLETVDNSTYLKKLEEMSLLMEHPLESLDKTVWWIEYVIRKPGVHHLRSPLADMFSYQYYLLDVGAFLLVLFILGIVVLYKSIKILFKKLLR